MEKHYRIKDLVEVTGFSRRTVRRLFDKEPGVIVLPTAKRRSVRRYLSITVPESVVQRVLNKLARAA